MQKFKIANIKLLQNKTDQQLSKSADKILDQSASMS